MAAAGFVVFYLFDAIGLVPAIHETVAREGTTVFGVSPQTILNVVFLGVAAVFGLVLYKGKRKSPEDRIVEDPVTGTEMPVGEADYCTVYEETIYYFESDESREQFRREHEDFLED
jgi:YHS domain-containing protein